MAEARAAAAPPTSSADPSERILTEVLKEQAYQDLSDRLKSLEAELEKEKGEKAAAFVEKKDLTFKNQQLEEANKAAQKSLWNAESANKTLQNRAQTTLRERTELQEDVKKLKEKSRSDDDWISKLRDQIESDSRTIRTLDSERGQAVADRDRYEHNHNILNTALETVRAEVKLYSGALIDKDAEFASYRTSHYAELQRSNLSVDSLNVDVSNLKAGKAEAQRQYEAKVSTVEQLERDKEDVQAKLDRYTKSFRDESSKLQAAITHLEVRAGEDRDSVEEFERALRQSDERHAIELDELQQVVDEATTARDAAITRMKEMEEAVDKLSSVWSDGKESSISATAHVLSEARESGQTIGQIYINSAKNGLALTKANEEVDRLQAVLKEVLTEIQIKAPELKQQRKDFEAVKAEAERLVVELDQAQRAKTEAESASTQLVAKTSSLESEGQSLRSQAADLSMQVRALVREIAVRDDPSLLYESFDIEQGRPAVDLTDIDLVITSNLTAFRKLPELVDQNKRLLRISRELGRKLEEPSLRPKPVGMEGDEMEDVMAEAQDVIYALKGEMEQLKQDLVDIRAQSDVFAKERDLFSRMLVQSRVGGFSTNGQSSSTDGQGDVAGGILDSLQQQFDQHRESFRSQITGLEARLKESGQAVQNESDRLTSALKSLAHEQKQNEVLRDQQSTDRATTQSHLATIAQRDASIEQLLEQCRVISEDRDTVRREVAALQIQVNANQGARAIFEQNELKRAEEIRTLADERATLRMQLGNRETLRGQELENLKLKRSELERGNEELERDLASLRTKLAREREQHHATRALVNKAEQQGLEEALAVARSRITELEGMMRETTASHDAAIATLQEQLKTSTEHLRQATESLINTRLDVTRNRDIGLKYQRAKKAVDEQLATARTDLQTREAELASARTEAASMTAQVGALQASVAESQPVIRSTAGDPDAALQAEISRLEGVVALMTANQAIGSAAMEEASSAAHITIEQLRTELVNAKGALSEAQNELARVKAEFAAQTAAASKDLEDLRSRITELEARPAILSNQAEAAPTTEPSDDLRQAREECTRLKAEFDTFKEEQTAKYDRDVTKVNQVNARLSTALKAKNETQKAQEQSTEEALAKQRSELEAEHAAAIAKQRADQDAQHGEAVAKLAAVPSGEDTAALQAELATTLAELTEAKTKILRVAVIESTSAKRLAEMDKLKAQIKALETKPKEEAPSQMSIMGAAVPVKPAVTPATTPARGRVVARGAGRGVARGAARGGAVAGRSAMGPNAVLAAAGYPKPGEATTQGAKRQASEAAKDDAEAKRIKTEDPPAPAPAP